jgi:hypothetical protein
VFVISPGGSGWVPSRHLSLDTGRAQATHDYDTTELPVSAGQDVAIVERDDRSGWWWCRSEEGREGWVPMTVLTEVG